MLKKESHVMGVDIGFKTINFSIFSMNGSFLKEKSISSPQPLMPGAVTIEICEGIYDFDQLEKIRCIGISLPGQAVINNRLIEKFTGLNFWENVPLVDWLEIRLNRKVIMGNFKEIYSVRSAYLKWLNSAEISFRGSFIAAFMASQYFDKTDYCE